MLEDKELGLKIAENPDEKFWIELKEKMSKQIDTMKREIVISEAIIELAESKIIKQNEEK